MSDATWMEEPLVRTSRSSRTSFASPQTILLTVSRYLPNIPSSGEDCVYRSLGKIVLTPIEQGGAGSGVHRRRSLGLVRHRVPTPPVEIGDALPVFLSI